MNEVVYPPGVFERESECIGFADTGLKYEELPDPALWRCLVLPKQPKRVSAGGIALPDQAMDAEMHLNYIGQIVKVGPLAGKNDRFQNPEWFDGCSESIPRYLWDYKPGDWVIFGRYGGMVLTYKGIKLTILNDDEIISRIQAPDGYKIYL